MTKSGMRTWFGAAIVICHLGLCGLMFAYHIRGAYSLDELLTTLALMAPMLASFVGIIVDEATSLASPGTTGSTATGTGTPATPASLPGAFVFFSWLFLICYIAFMVTIILLRSYNIGIQTYGALKTLIAVGETACGIYLARFVKTLFEKS